MNPMTFVLTLALVQFGAVKGKVTQIDGLTPIKGMRVDAYNAITKKLTYSDHSDSLGYYNINRLPSGQYKIRTYDWSSTYSNLYYNNVLHWDAAETLTVTEPDSITDIDFQLPTGGKIKGKMYHADGVTAYTGYGLVGAYFSSDGDIACIAIKDTTTENYSLGGLQSGWYKVILYPMDYGMQGDTIHAMEFYNNAYQWNQAQDIYVSSPDSVLGIDAAFDTGATITGHVLDSNGMIPMGNAAIACFLYLNDFFGWSQYYDAIFTDTTGHYRLYSLMSGNYKVRAVKSGYDTLWYNNQADSSTANLVSVAMPNNTPNIDFNMQITGVAEEYITEYIQQRQKIDLTISPNPVSSKAVIKYVITANSPIMLDIYNISGQRVKRLEHGKINTGTYLAYWNGGDDNNQRMPNGVYICRLVCGSNLTTTKILLLR